MNTAIVILAALMVITILVMWKLVQKRSSVDNTVKRNLMNYELEIKYEGFHLMYDDLRQIDFKGAVLIHNSTHDKWYCHSSNRVFRDARRIFRGELGPKQIREDLRAGAKFSVRAVKLDISGYSSCGHLRHALLASYTAEKEKY